MADSLPTRPVEKEQELHEKEDMSYIIPREAKQGRGAPWLPRGTRWEKDSSRAVSPGKTNLLGLGSQQSQRHLVSSWDNSHPLHPAELGAEPEPRAPPTGQMKIWISTNK